jgi:predicted MFS family arabinose efflux permease
VHLPPPSDRVAGPAATPLGAVLLPFAAGYYISYLFRTVNAVIAPELTAHLGLGPADLGLLTSTYFLAFALAQIPVGVALDRWGPRRVVSALLLVAAGGAVVFARGSGFAQLAGGRALIGIGVSACLMGGLKALFAAFPVDRQASLTGIIMSAGAFGALTASSPLQAALPLLGWRGALLGVAGISAAVAILVFVVVPRTLVPGGPGESLTAQLGAFRGIAASRAFWRFAAQAGLVTGGYMAVQGLWAVPFLVTAAGRSRVAAAATLLVLNFGMLAGQASIGVGAGYLRRRGIGRHRLMSLGLALALAVEAIIIAWPGTGSVPWFCFGFFAAAGGQVYGEAASGFHPDLSARVSTAVNQFAFIGAFAIQWGLGGLVQALSKRMDAPAAFRATFAALWLLQVAALGWSGVRGVAGTAGEGGR